MSQENVELIQAFFDAGRAQMERTGASTHRWLAVIDLPETAAVFEEYWHPQAVFDVSGRLDGGIYHGPEGVRQGMRDWLVAWEEFDIEFKQFLSAGDRVVVVQDFKGIVEGGIEVELRDFCGVYTVRDGRLAHYEEYLDIREALDAVGLPEPA
jgi:ketosteroid isomerase-like protein